MLTVALDWRVGLCGRQLNNRLKPCRVSLKWPCALSIPNRRAKSRRAPEGIERFPPLGSKKQKKERRTGGLAWGFFFSSGSFRRRGENSIRNRALVVRRDPKPGEPSPGRDGVHPKGIKDMRKLILAACLAAPLLMLQPQKARAQCNCDICDLAHWLRNHYCSCWRAKHGQGLGAPGCGGNCGGGGCGCGCHLGLPCGLLNPFGCDSYVPGPWYLYFPYDGQTQVMAGYGRNWPGGWNYEYHFRSPAPIGDWFPNMAAIPPASPAEYPLPPQAGAALLPRGPAEAALTAPPGVRVISDQ
jgi:hypothetical protein